MTKHLCITISLFLLIGCQPTDADYISRSLEFKETEIGRDLSNGKFVPPYDSSSPLIEYAAWCRSVLWPTTTKKQQFSRNQYLKEEVFNIADSKVVGVVGLLNGLIEASGGADTIYPYVHGDAAYLMKPSRMAIPVLKSMYKKYRLSPSYKKSVAIIKNSNHSEAFEEANNLCMSADLVVGMLGGTSESRAIYKEVSDSVNYNTLRSRR